MGLSRGELRVDDTLKASLHASSFVKLKGKEVASLRPWPLNRTTSRLRVMENRPLYLDPRSRLHWRVVAHGVASAVKA